MTIDGYTQPGTKKNTKAVGTDAVLKVALDGTNVAGDFDLGLNIAASNVVVRGMVITGFNSIGILVNGTGARIEGNFIGSDTSGTQDRENGDGIDVRGLNTTVGGATLDKRNLISGNRLVGVRLQDSGAKVLGNLIGTQKDGSSPRAMASRA